MNIDLEKLRKHEQDRFAITVEFDHMEKTDIVLSVTHNGRQWSNVSFTSREEAEKAIRTLQDFLANAKTPS